MFLDDDIKECFGFPVIGRATDTIVITGDKFVAISNAKIKERIQREIEVVTLVHPDVVIGKKVEIGKELVAMAGTVINPDMVIREGCIVNTLASIDNDCIILYAYVHVAVEGHLLLGIMIPLSVLLVLTAVDVVMMKGNPFFIKERPDLNEKVLKFVIFCTMTNEKDKNG